MEIDHETACSVRYVHDHLRCPVLKFLSVDLPSDFVVFESGCRKVVLDEIFASTVPQFPAEFHCGFEGESFRQATRPVQPEVHLAIRRVEHEMSLCFAIDRPAAVVTDAPTHNNKKRSSCSLSVVRAWLLESEFKLQATFIGIAISRDRNVTRNY